MENWGLITYPESRLLFDSAIHPSSRPFKMAEAMAHELSHQWFGNLVTPNWWSYLWLSEGLATLFETLATDLVCVLISMRINSIEFTCHLSSTCFTFRFIHSGQSSIIS